MIPRSVSSHVVTFAVGAASAFVIIAIGSQSQQASNKDDQERPAGDVNDGSTMLPLLPVKLYQPNSTLTIMFDTRTKNPLCVVERLAKRPDEEVVTRRKRKKNQRFHEETNLPTYHRSRNHYYRNSGFDRGHLAPAADASNEVEIEDTFTLANVSPQRQHFNRSTWLRLEEFVRSVAEDNKDSETWVATGPLWLPSVDRNGASFQYAYEGIGKPPSIVSVPTHFFKVITVVDKSGKLEKVGSFVFGNSDKLRGDPAKFRLIEHIVRLEDLEAVSGLEFFPKILGSYGKHGGVPPAKELADALTDDLMARNEMSGKGGADGLNSCVKFIPDVDSARMKAGPGEAFVKTAHSHSTICVSKTMLVTDFTMYESIRGNTNNGPS